MALNSTQQFEKRIVTFNVAFHHGHECKLPGSKMADADRRCSCVSCTGGL
jgi:hypothetical protein